MDKSIGFCSPRSIVLGYTMVKWMTLTWRVISLSALWFTQITDLCSSIPIKPISILQQLAVLFILVLQFQLQLIGLLAIVLFHIWSLLWKMRDWVNKTHLDNLMSISANLLQTNVLFLHKHLWDRKNSMSYIVTCTSPHVSLTVSKSSTPSSQRNLLINNTEHLTALDVPPQNTYITKVYKAINALSF